MLVVSTETNKVDVPKESQKDAKMNLVNNIESRISNKAFDDLVAGQIPSRDTIVRLVGSEIVDSFKTRMCVTVGITESEHEGFLVKYTPMPIRFYPVSDEGIDCLNKLEIWFLVSMALTLLVAILALIRAWAHRYDFKKVISPRYKWFGINHGGSPGIKDSHVPSNIFANPCHCFDYLGFVSNNFAVVLLIKSTKNILNLSKMTSINFKKDLNFIKKLQGKLWIWFSDMQAAANGPIILLKLNLNLITVRRGFE